LCVLEIKHSCVRLIGTRSFDRITFFRNSFFSFEFRSFEFFLNRSFK
jgi:hypothetical protein